MTAPLPAGPDYPLPLRCPAIRADLIRPLLVLPPDVDGPIVVDLDALRAEVES